jgi:hypothetical protein
VDVENVLCLHGGGTIRVDEQLLDHEARRIRYEHVEVGRDRKLSLGADSQGPWLDEQDVQVPQLLCGNARNRRGRVALSPLHFAPDEGREELGVEACVLVAEPIVRCRRRIFPERLLGEASLRQCIAHIAFEGLGR